ncbi:hypothetical protein CRUP_025988 [Coryphaenoides rupestris]|nr:hypothetical protein CRUP_025988 [Coryphaenoides rupestris]
MDLIFLKVDLHCPDNNSAHHTSDITTKELVVRRGQSFLLTLELPRPFNPKTEQLHFTALTGTRASEELGTRSLFGTSEGHVTRSPGAKARWRAGLHETASPATGRLTLAVTPPADAPVGKYFLSVQRGDKEASLGSLVLLFNPWCPEDWVHLPDEEERQEYVMNEHGVIFKGTDKYIIPMTWDYGQFEEDMVDICMKLLDVNPKHLRDPTDDVSARCNPIYVSRVVSAMINASDDHGVLVGNWGPPDRRGVSPSVWNGSVDILQRWWRNGCHAVRYGQCWVFAGVMNFHVWVEAWMRRPDLDEGGAYDGWQVLDPTPQEKSEGSEKERSIYKHALTRDYSMDGHRRPSVTYQPEGAGGVIMDENTAVSITPPPQKVAMQIEEVSVPVIGHDLQLKVSVPVIGHDLQLKVTLSSPDPVAQPLVNVSAVATDLQSPELVYLAESNLVLQDPPITITVKDRAQLYRPLEVEVAFKNPLKETLQNCTFSISGSGLLHTTLEKRLPDMLVDRGVQMTLSITPYRTGPKTLAVDFDCSAFRNAKASATIDPPPAGSPPPPASSPPSPPPPPTGSLRPEPRGPEPHSPLADKMSPRCRWLELKQAGNDSFKAGQYGEAAQRYSQAIKELEKSSNKSPEDLSILYSNRAASYLKNGNCSECVKDCNMSLELVPFGVKSLLRRAAAYEALERYRQAYVDYKTALLVDCNIPAAHDGTNRMTKVLTEVDGPGWREKLPDLPAMRRAQVLKDEGNALVKKGHFQKAVDKYSQSLKLNPTEITTYTNRALCYLSVKQYREAVRDCDAAVAMDGGNIKALYRRAQAHRELKDSKACVEDLNRLLRVEPNNLAALKLLQEVQKKKKNKIDMMFVHRRERNVEEEEEDGADDTSSIGNKDI